MRSRKAAQLFAMASAIALIGGAAFAQDAVVTSANVVPYPPAFFAEFEPVNALDMISQIPGFSFDGGGDSRGFAGNAGNVLIDGERPPSRGDSLDDVLARIPASGVERIDLIRGGAPGVDMQGRAIIANVIRRKGASLAGSYQANVDSDGKGSFSTYDKVQAQRQKDGRVLDGSLTYISSDDKNQSDRVRRLADDTIDETGFETGVFTYEQFEATGAYETPLLGGKLRANGQASTNDTSFDDREILLDGGTVDGGSNHSRGAGGEDRGEAGLRWTRNILKGFSLEMVGFQSLTRNRSSSQSVRPAFSSGSIETEDSGESIGSLTLHSRPYGHWKFDAGSELAFNWVDNTTARTIDGAVLALDGDTSRVEELRADTSAAGTWTPTKTLSLETGVRYEHSTISAGPVEKTVSFIKPRVNLSWTPRPGHQLGLRIERTVDQLSFDAYQSSVNFNSTLGNTIFGVGNNDIDPTNTWIADLRYERRWGDQGSFVADLVHNEVDDVIGRVVIPAPTADNPGRTVEISRNIGRASRTYVNVSSSIPLDGAGLKAGILDLGFNVRTSNIVDPVTGLERRLGGDTPFDWRVSLARNIREGSEFSWSVYYNSSGYSRSWGTQSISRFEFGERLGASLSWKPNKDLSLTFGLNNLTAAGNQNTFVFYTAPRDKGVPQFTDDDVSKSRRRAFITLRKSFG